VPLVLLFKPTFENYRLIFKRTSFGLYFINSLIIAFGATLVGLILGLPCAYGIAHYKKEKLGLLILSARILPMMAFLVPWFIIFSKLELKDTYISLILAHSTITLPLITWIMIGFFEEIPVALSEAAHIDGCSPYQAFLKIALPLSLPGIATSSILSIIFSLNDLLFALVLAGPNTSTLPLAIFNFISFSQVDWGQLNAAATLVTLPVILLVFIIQKYIVKGLTMGAVKE
jgi:multiple sugar transport system permease protein